jgi:hypothetical protein
MDDDPYCGDDLDTDTDDGGDDRCSLPVLAVMTSDGK